MKYFCFDSAINGTYTLLLLKNEYPQQQCLFHETKDAAIWDVAPWLFAIGNNVYEHLNTPLASLHHAVFFESGESLETVLAHLQTFIYKTLDGKEYFFRFWDARVLLNYLSGCSAQELELFFGDSIDTIYLEAETKENLLALTINRKSKLGKKVISKNSFFGASDARFGETLPAPGEVQPEQGSIEPSTNKRRFLTD
jgi:Domain of unknown function (DUF4123)